MKIIKSVDFFSKVGMCSAEFIVDIIKTFHIEFITVNINIDREDIEEICIESIEEKGYNWSPDDITVIYDIYDATEYDSMAKCAILHKETSQLINIFKKSQKLKVFI